MTTSSTIPHTRIGEDRDIEDSYEVGKKLGEGAFGRVHEAKHKETGVTWAIKSINKEKAGSSAIKLIEREVAILKRVNHPNIIRLNEVLEAPKRIFLVMELCEGGELADRLKDGKHFTEEDTKTVIKRLASAIAYLHKHDIVHRDIKLENILLSQNPDDPDDKLHIKVTDFGLSVVKGGVGHDNMMQDFCGTPMYMSPEILDNKTYSQQCDVWAMGVIMYILLCGYAPFRSSDEATLYDIIKKAEVSFDDDPWPNISSAAKTCIERMLKFDPAHRMSAAELLDHAWLTGGTHDSSQPVNVIEMMKQWGPELKKGGNCEDDAYCDSAINGDSTKDGATSDHTAHHNPIASKSGSSETRKGSGGSKRNESRTPPNSGSKTGAQARNAKSVGQPGPAHKSTTTASSKAAATGNRTGTTTARVSTGAAQNKKTTMNSTNGKAPARTQKK